MEQNKPNNKQTSGNISLSIIIALFALVVAIIAAYFSYCQNRISKDTAERQLRAYVSFEINAWRGFTKNEPLAVQIALINYGQTPATGVKITGQIEILPFPLPSSYKPQYSQIGSIAQITTIFPNKGYSSPIGWIPVKDVFSSEEISLITSPKSKYRAYMFGHIVYNDIFNHERNTYFCQFIDPLSILYNENGSINTFIWANYMDYNDCN